MRSIKNVFSMKDEIVKQDLDDIVNQIRSQTRELVGQGVMQNVEDVNRMNFKVYFRPRE